MNDPTITSGKTLAHFITFLETLLNAFLISTKHPLYHASLVLKIVSMFTQHVVTGTIRYLPIAG